MNNCPVCREFDFCRCEVTMTHTTKLIPISGACHDGCQLMREPISAIVRRNQQMAAALDHLLKLTEAFQKAPVQSRSVERKYVLLIERAIREAQRP